MPKVREELIWTRMEAPTDAVLGQEFEFEGKMVKVVDYEPEGIATLTVEYERSFKLSKTTKEFGILFIIVAIITIAMLFAMGVV